MIVEKIDPNFKQNHANEIWNSALVLIKDQVHEQSFSTWFKPILPISIQENSILLEVPSQFFYDWIESHYPKLIRSSIDSVAGEKIEVKYMVKQQQSISFNDPVRIDETQLQNSPSNIKQKLPDNVTQLNQRFTFSNFIEGDGNKFARAAALAVSEAPGKTAFNPLLIFGDTGLGKTHLMHAMGNFALEEGTVRKVYYVTSEQFTADFINSIQKNKTSEFTQFYRTIDLLLIDDIQFFSNKGKTQEEFFHTFNALHMAGKQIVLSCDRAPSEIKDLEDRLLSRFQCGLVVDIQPPDFETRLAILKKKVGDSGVNLPDDLAEYLASNVTSSIRELEGALIRIMAQASMTGEDLNLDLAKTIIQKFGNAEKKAITIETIMRETANYFGVQENLLLAKTRKKEIVIARQISMYLAKILTSHTVKSIGLHFGGRDHTTVLYSVKMIEDQLQCDHRTAQHVENIRRSLEKFT